MFAHKFLEKINFLCPRKKCQILMLFTAHAYFTVLPRPDKIFFFFKNLCRNIECLDLHVKFMFVILKFVINVFFK
jgi:hypothetical protein